MLKFIKSILGISIVCFRLYVIFMISYLLVKFSSNKTEMFNEVSWYLSALLLDLYFLCLDNNLGPYIYSKDKNEQGATERN